jgi:natural product biosynthesis luciferase-like monooxygenase protein
MGRATYFMNVIGISGLAHSLSFKQRKMPGLSPREYYIGQGFDAAAALVTDNGIAAAVAEERFTREKATGAFPLNAIHYCLAAAKLRESEIDWIAHGFSYEPYRDLFQNEAFTPAQYAEVYSPEVQRKLLQEHFPKTRWADKFVPVQHHLAHAASAFYPSGFDQSLILVSDGMGEAHSATVALGKGNDIEVLAEIPAFHSLGTLYGVFSLYLGFYMNSDEYKVMGLAPYGNPRRFLNQMLSLVNLKSDGTYTIPAFARNRTLEERETHRGIINHLVEVFGPAREPESDITQTHKDLAAGLQALLQTCQLHLLRHFKRQTGQKNLCLAGGVALNCSTNGVIKRSELFDRVFIQPAAGDDGTALGAALWVQRQKNPKFKRPANTVPLWGPEFGEAQIATALDPRKDCRVVQPESYEALCREVATHLNRGKIVAWFQGRMEFGPRALGSRSILADPRDPTMRDRINALVKKREAFRPFAPVVAQEAAAGIFEIKPGDEETYAHMLFVTHVRPDYRSKLPAITHVDGSARVQTVSEEQNPRLWKLLNEFGSLSGIPVLLNTSFNVRGQPIVCTPEEALDTFLKAKLDLLVLGDYLVFPVETERVLEPEPEIEPGIEGLQEVMDRHEEFWVNRLADLDPIVLPFKRADAKGAATPQVAVFRPPVTESLSPAPNESVTVFTAFLARLCRTEHFHLAFGTEALRQAIKGHEAACAQLVPLEVDCLPHQSFQAFRAMFAGELDKVRAHKTFASDLAQRHPALSHSADGPRTLPVAVYCGNWSDQDRLPDGVELMLVAPESGGDLLWVYDARACDAETITRIAGHFAAFTAGLLLRPDQPIQSAPLLTDAERKIILRDWNDTHRVPPPRFCVHEAFEVQARKTPDSVALAFEGQELTYRELDRRAAVMAQRLRQLKVGPDAMVGVCLDVSLEMMVALMGVLKAGAAYVPLDPGYPKERIGFMIRDANLPVLITDRRRAAMIPEAVASVDRSEVSDVSDRSGEEPGWNGSILLVDDPAPEAGEDLGGSIVTPDNLAYVIYTSGSTGKPKGVMINHANVANFFAAMDERLGTEPGVWLAVTSMCFDISVLELFWTLSRGYKVILQRRQERGTALAPAPARQPNGKHTLDFSLFYFAADASGQTNKYRLLLEGAKFADKNGFAAVWTPERHFHAFGGLYPNPSITSAALAVATERIKIRAGSVVLPLHHPVRVAEEWAVVDNLSGGRVAISFASGWQINDFILAPQNHAGRKEIMVDQINTVKKLWRGEAVAFPDPKGAQVPVKILPRPIQPELPVWITASGNPETYKLAGELGANVLTHLLGQNISELAEKIRAYREAWRSAGHPGDGQVTLMIHTFVGPDLEQVRETVRQPFTAYLKTSIDLIKNDPWAFSTFKRPAAPHNGNGRENGNGNGKGNGNGNGHSRPSGKGNGTPHFTEEEMEAIARHAFERHFTTSGLFGTPRHCLSLVQQIRASGVDEIACLIDFGVAHETVLSNLSYLNELRELASTDVAADRSDYSVAAQIRTHGVTHLQCTPSMAAMLAEDPQTLDALRGLKTLLLGGEALPGALVDKLQFPGELLNMYGPTETTIWSATQRVDSAPAIVPIGKPVANTDIYIVDERLEPQPTGVPGEVLIGGAGVVRGYLHRPQLTAERFLPNPFKPRSGERVYRTGDLARYAPDGTIEFLGRIDHQVKLRGFRIELGEIEAVLRGHASVKDCVCIVREDNPGDKRLVAYIVPNSGPTLPTRELRQFAQSKLPDYMTPSGYVPLPSLPLTPNGKIDRKALPRPQFGTEMAALAETPGTPVERKVIQTMRELLGVPAMELSDDFFALGGNSLLATQLIGRLRESFASELPLRLAFEHPTPQALAQAIVAQQRGDDGSTAAAHEMLQRTAGPERPLSFAQQRIWFLHQLEPGSHYNDHFDLRLDGPVDISALERAINAIVQRHETLRASFAKQDGNPVQRIASSLRVPVPLLDLVHLNGDAERQAEQAAINECNQPFDLEKGPLLRVLLIRLAEQRHILVLTFDHIVIDGWSHGVFLSELSALYQAFLEGKPSPLPALPLQYSDFAVWQSRQLEGEVTRRHLAYWKEQLAQAPALLALPTDRPRPAVPSYRGAREGFGLPRDLTANLAGVGRQDGCTLFMVLLGAFQALLGRYAEAEEILIGSPIANRNRTEIEGLIGSFMNTLVLRGDLRGDPTFRELLRRVRRTALDAYTHQDLPFEKLVAELKPARNLSYSPLFQVMFILQNTPMPPRDCGALQFSSYDVDAGSSKLDLTLNLEETANGCEGWIEYSTDLFDRGTIVRMIADFKGLLERIAAGPGLKLSELLPRLTLTELPERLRTSTSMTTTGTASVSVSAAELPTVQLSTVELAPSRRPDLRSTPAQKEMAKIWCDVLGVAEVGLDDNLFDLGGHSLLVTRIISRIRKSFDVEVPIHAFFETPTLGAIAEIVERSIASVGAS